MKQTDSKRNPFSEEKEYSKASERIMADAAERLANIYADSGLVFSIELRVDGMHEGKRYQTGGHFGTLPNQERGRS